MKRTTRKLINGRLAVAKPHWLRDTVAKIFRAKRASGLRYSVKNRQWK